LLHDEVSTSLGLCEQVSKRRSHRRILHQFFGSHLHPTGSTQCTPETDSLGVIGGTIRSSGQSLIPQATTAMMVAVNPTTTRYSPTRQLFYTFFTMCSVSRHDSVVHPTAASGVAPSSARNALLTFILPPYQRRDVFMLIAICLMLFPLLLYTFHPGVRRTVQFYSTVGPLVAEHKFVQFRNRLDRFLRRSSREKEALRIRRFHQRAAPRITKKMVDLGGIYIKIGQVLSTVGSGFLDEAYVKALKPLQDGVPPRDYQQISNIIESSTGQSMDTLFEQFEKAPVGAASIAQAHRAVLKDSHEQVIVKVQYPEVARLFEIDFDNLETVVRWLDPSNMELVDALRKRHQNEMDFTQEANNLRIIRRNLQRHGVEPSRVRVPIVKNETGICNENVLVMEYLEGQSLSSAMEQEQNRYARALGKEDAEELKSVLMERMKEHMEHGGGAGSGSLKMMEGGTRLLQTFGPTGVRLFRAFAGIKESLEDVAVSCRVAGAKIRNSLTRREIDAAHVTSKRRQRSHVNLGRAIKTLVHVHGLQMIKDGVFNLDSHPGNVLILPDGTLGLLDFGMVGRLDEDDRLNVAKTIVALSRRDKEEVARLYTDAGYRASWKEGNVTDPDILYRFASFHFDRIDLSDVSLKDDGGTRKVGIMEILRTTRERAIPFWIEDGRRLGGLLIGTASQAARPISLANEWRSIAEQVARKQGTKK
jgi:predicted unusual protein kinase regulating ubiquinone biosynthesis (AarF/ABC1/UbiB family)